MKKNLGIFNSLANLTSRILNLLFTLIFIPIYLKFLGHDAYGIVAFQTTLQVIFSFLEFGIPATLNREMAKLSSEQKDELQEKADLIKTTEILSFSIGIIVLSLITIFSKYITHSWLQIGSLNPEVVQLSIIIIAVQISVQYVQNNYFVSLNGLSHQFYPNIITTASSFLKGIIIILLFNYYGGDLRIYFVVNLLFTILTLVFFRKRLIKIIDGIIGKFNLNLIYKHKKFALQIVIYSLILSTSAQLDKFLISSQLPIKQLGFYSISFSVSNAIAIFGSSIITAYYPQLVKSATSNADNFTDYYLKMSKLVSLVILPMVFFLGIYGSDIIYIWTKDTLVSQNASSIILLMTLTSYLSIINSLPLNYSLAKSNMATIIFGQFIIVVTLIAPTIFLIKYFLLKGAAISSLLNVLIIYLILSFFIHKKHKFSHHLQWLYNTSLYPFILSFPILWLFNLISIKYITTPINRIYFSFLPLTFTYLIIFFLLKKNDVFK
jgi:O-antigen/teichoic acid export membrane protein